MAEAPVVLDCADSFPVSYALSDACMAAGVSLVSASVLALGGYAGRFYGQAPSRLAVFPDLPDRPGSCAAAGILGPVVGMLGALLAQLVVAVLLGLAPSPLGQLVTLAPGLRWGGFRFDGAPEPEGGFPFIDTAQISPGDFVVDLRGGGRSPPARPSRGDAPAPPGARAVFACRRGLRAWRAARATAARHPNEIALIATGDAL